VPTGAHYRRGVPDYQRIHVVSTTATEAELERLRRELRRQPVVLTAPTAEGQRVVGGLGLDAAVAPELLLAPVRFPEVDRGHRLDGLVRAHALHDRFRDVVVVTDPASVTLLLRVLAPDQLSTGGGVTLVGLARGERPVVLRRAVTVGVVLGVVVAAAGSSRVVLALPLVVAVLGALLLLVVPVRHLARELLLAAAVSVAVGTAVVAGSARFPAAW
jgi:hypothetical protein